MITKNDVTGDRIVSKSSNAKYAEGWELIFGKKKFKKKKQNNSQGDDAGIRP